MTTPIGVTNPSAGEPGFLDLKERPSRSPEKTAEGDFASPATGSPDIGTAVLALLRPSASASQSASVRRQKAERALTQKHSPVSPVPHETAHRPGALTNQR
jgi:hypothetical protein